MTYFMIQDRNTGLFSSGGTDPTWVVKGKTWKKINHVKSHVTQFVGRKTSFYDDADIIEYEFTPSITNRIEIAGLLVEKVRERQERYKNQKDRYAQLEYERAKALVEKYEQRTNSNMS